MRCPRCGLDNEPTVRACVRCGLPVPGAPPPSMQQRPPMPPPQQPLHRQPAPPPQPPYPQPQHYPDYQPASYTPWQPTPMARRAPRSPVAAIIAMFVAALLALGYAVWSFTVRQGIFADLADGVTVTTEDAHSSDVIDTLFGLAAGATAVVAVVLWLMALTDGRWRGRTMLAGLIATALGVIVVFTGLFLGGAIGNAEGQAAQADRGVTACIVTGAGFALVAIGLLTGAIALRDHLDDSPKSGSRVGVTT